MTMPTLIQHYKKQEASARLKKFYSTMLQAIKMSEIEQGDMTGWTRDGDTQKDENGNSDLVANGKITKDFFLTYLAPYFKYTSIKDAENDVMDGDEVLIPGKDPKIYLTDGSTIELWNGSCIDVRFDVNGDKLPNERGKDIFVYLICFTDENRYNHCGNTKKSFCTYGDSASISKNRIQVRDLCKNAKWHHHCSRLLEFDNWEFKEDYPFKL